MAVGVGVYLATRPRYSTIVVVSGTSYYYAGGVYYVSRGSRYVVVNPPRGAVVYAVPTVTTVVYLGRTPYYYYNGTYYLVTDKPAAKPEVSETNINVNVNITSNAEPDQEEGLQTITSTIQAEGGEEMELPPVPIDDEQNYEVVSPPVGVTVPYLPESADEETVGGTTYFVSEGTYYKAYASDGDIIYMVVEKPEGVE